MSKVAVVQTSPVVGSTPATIAKAERLIREAGANGATVAVFPEAFIGGYPKGASFDTVVGTRTALGREEYREYFDSAITLSGPEIETLCVASAESGVFAVIGIIERHGDTLYCTAALIDPEQGLVGNHRKLMPTASERLIWGFGDGSTLHTADTAAGRVGTAICWENYMPMLRQAMYAKGVDLYCTPTVDDRPAWQSSMTHIALEGRNFVLSACQALPKSAYPEGTEFLPQIGNEHWVIRGGSVIIDPLGNVLAGPVYEEETILYADIDLSDRTRAHFDLDVTGHYGRPDVFELRVDTRAKSGTVFDA
ncbi:carbon-nitrogen hydrolase family protein [Leucobacter sp. UT-8R-CII-1-4]|uniref:carbon-nitrogen hydrolase family protein n=1 Tax=Leucobacter sp. UT-8R-CII-1-4 TaxID=3040075 RepID=UPI0024A910B9|nr:carbon-nitrogen hydrolase family protein [Leucobacter sp. UT-8R-CII-1-4]MDI6024013.1 carbon-nitrogen hydrolase family protein [Leucobacter sp. UT-8R-CII-1-4]